MRLEDLRCPSLSSVAAAITSEPVRSVCHAESEEVVTSSPTDQQKVQLDVQIDFQRCPGRGLKYDATVSRVVDRLLLVFGEAVVDPVDLVASYLYSLHLVVDHRTA